MFLLDSPEVFFKKKSIKYNNLIVYLHVPKAAGNSSIGSIKEHYEKSKIKSIQWNNIDSSFNEFVSEHKNNQYNLVSGHFRFKHVQKLIDEDINFDLVTFIRHPVERIISQYKYQCTEVEPNHLEFRKKFPTFDKYAYNAVGANVVSRILVQGALSFDEYIKKIKNRYMFVGLSEYYNLSMLLLLNYFGMDYSIAKRRNITHPNKFNTFDVSMKTYNYLLEKHSLDVQLYKYFENEYKDISKKYIKYLIQDKIV